MYIHASSVLFDVASDSTPPLDCAGGPSSSVRACLVQVKDRAVDDGPSGLPPIGQRPSMAGCPKPTSNSLLVL